MYKSKNGRHYWFAKKMIEKGYEVAIFCANTFHNTKDFIDTGKKKYIVNSIEEIPFVFVKTTSAIGNGLARVKNMALFYWNILSVANKYANEHGKPDIIIASSVHPLTMIAGIQLARKLRIQCVCEIRDLWPEAIFAYTNLKEKSILGRLLIAGEHWIYRNADALIFTKEGDIDYLKEKKWDVESGGDIDLSKAHYINNGIDVATYYQSINDHVLKDPDLELKVFTVVYIGAIRPVNNLELLIDAAKILKINTDIQILIYGEGNQREYLQQRVIDEGITNVKIKGAVENRYVPYILSKSSINVLNYSQTRYNWARGNSSNKLFEYMASGKPIVSTVRMGYSIIDRYNCGIEIENSSADELARTILELYNMPPEERMQLGKNGKLGVCEFDFGVLVSKLINVIKCL
jgi:glycosyltransferase involved in cell wall biosynthesis